MADQIFSVNSGFYDAVNNDRTYSADDMNRPYRRIVTNGVFATPQGTASTDLLVESAENGMYIIVNAGEGIFADKWFENPASISILVPSNTNIVPRIDSVIIQVDERQSGRVGNIVYRTGTPASSPVAPDINQVTNVTEYRLANIYVAASATTISNDAITDLRGTSSCPWVTSLIQQVARQIMTASLDSNISSITPTAFTVFPLARNNATGTRLTFATGGIKIGADVSKVLVSAKMSITCGNTDGTRYVVIVKNSYQSDLSNTLAWATQSLSAGDRAELVIPMTLGNVSEDDVIYLCYYLRSGDQINGDDFLGQTNLTVEVVA